MFPALAALALLLLPATLAAQGFGLSAAGSGAEAVPPPPASHVLDAGGVFRRSPEEEQRISQRLRELERNQGVRIYVVAYAGLLGATVQEQAIRFQEAWLPDGDGFVIVCDTDSRQLEIGYPATVNVPAPGQPGNSSASPGIQRYQIALALENLGDGLNMESDPAIYLEGLADRIAAHFEATAAAPEDPAQKTAETRFVLFVVAAVIAAALAGLLISRLTKRSDASSARRHYLPDVMVGMRLGAPYGGGLTSSRNYATPRSPHTAGPADPAHSSGVAGDGAE